MKKLLNARIEMAFISLVLILAMFAFMMLNGSVAWFANNDDVEANGMQITVRPVEPIVKSVHFYPISSITLNGDQNVYTFSGEEASDRALETYSTVDATRQLLIKIELMDGVDTAHVTAISSISSYPIENSDTVLNMHGNSLSSVIEFHVATDVSIEEDGSYVISGADLSGSIKRFASVEEENGAVIIDFNSEIEIFTYSKVDGLGDNSIYIILDYYEDSVEYVVEHINSLVMSSVIIANPQDKIQFICDFDILVS